MRDYLKNFSGSYRDKIPVFMRTLREHVLDIPYGQDELEDIKSRNEMMIHYDYTNARLNRRIKATIKYQQEAHKRLQGILSPKEIDGLFAYGNGMILRGGYDAADRCHVIVLAAAIWILDQLNLQGDLQKAYPYIPEVDDDEVLCHPVMHPQYDDELICGMVKLLLYRNHDAFGGLGTMEYLAVNYDVAVTSYYSTDEIIYSTPTDYANNRGAYFMTRVTDDLGIIKSRNSYTNDNVEDSLANNCWYWLRSPGVYQNVAAIVSYSGLIRFSGGMVDYAHGGIRPAMWVNLEDGEN